MSSLAVDHRVFVDTSAFFAAAIPRDSNHRGASATMVQRARTTTQLVTTNFVLAELHGLLIARDSRETAFTILALARQSPLTRVVRVDERDEERAWAIITQYDDKDFSLTDATSFAIMERLGLRTAFAFDRHFVQFGWDIVPLDA